MYAICNQAGRPILRGYVKLSDAKRVALDFTNATGRPHEVRRSRNQVAGWVS